MEESAATPGTRPAPRVKRRGQLRSAAAAAGAGAVGAVGAGVGELTYRRRLANDPEHRRLLHPLRGRPVSARSADGTVIYSETFGPDDGATFVLAPGWTETLAYFDSMTRELVARGFRVVAYDLRGQGRSAPAAGRDWDLDRYGEDLEAVLAATCDGRRDVVVAGHSMGAMSIVAWARHHDVSARVRGAALMNTGLAGLIRATTILPQLLPDAVAEPLGRWAFMGNAMPVPPVSTAVSRAVVRYVAFGPYASDAEVAFYERMLMACPPHVRAHAGLAMCDMNLLDGLSHLDVPTLVLFGRLDRLTPVTHAEQIAAQLPNLLRLIEVPGTGHMGPLEDPHQLVLGLLEVAAATEAGVASAPMAASVV
jgi:pimeloyl-ACP methyl ester carboxylesterase